jgi:hypothetical protein
MKWKALIIAIIMVFCAGAVGQLDQYSTSAPGGAPTPVTPTSPESLGLQVPSAVSASEQAPSTEERMQELTRTDQESAYAAAPQGLEATSTSPTYNRMILPPSGSAPNNLYISYAPQTVASCYLYANLPLWMKTSTGGPIWFYEWYPKGRLDTQFAGNVYYPGWYKRWFFADVPGWHILQYYCNGWSNYAYIYVTGPGGYWVNPDPNPDPFMYNYPYRRGQITYTYPSTGHTYWF